jgi:hypothetical protein
MCHNKAACTNFDEEEVHAIVDCYQVGFFLRGLNVTCFDCTGEGRPKSGDDAKPPGTPKSPASAKTPPPKTPTGNGKTSPPKTPKKEDADEGNYGLVSLQLSLRLQQMREVHLLIYLPF